MTMPYVTSTYSWDPLAVQYFLAALLLYGSGGAVLLYERFTEASRRYFLLATVTASWLATLGLAVLATDAQTTAWWLRATWVLGPFTAPAFYLLAHTLAGVRVNRAWLLWSPVAAFLVLNLMTPWLVDGLRSFTRSYTLTGGGWVGAAYFIYITTVGALGVRKLSQWRSRSVSREERLERLPLMAAAAVGMLTLVDYWLPTETLRAGPVSPFAFSIAAVIGGLVAIRYRVFSITRSVGTEEVLRERAEAERALRAAERRYRSLFWHNPGSSYEFDREGRFVAMNPAAEALLGMPAETLRDQSFGKILHPEDVEEATGIFQAVLAGQSREYELRVITAGGDVRRIRGVSIPIFEAAEVVGVFGVALDVTEAARVKQQLEVQRRYFADLFESSPEGIVLVEAETDRVHRINEEFTRMFGWTSEEAVGRDLNELIVPEELRDEGWDLNRTARARQGVRTETVRRAKDGTRMEVSVLARELRIPGEPVQLYGVYRDITDRKRTERALREREEELRHAQKMEAVGNLAGGIAHDFNNLVTVINGHARFALEETESGSSLEGDLLEIEKAGARAAELTQQLLAYSRRQVLHPQALDPNVVILELQGMLRRLIGEHIDVETVLAPDGTRVRADRGQLEQVLVNLVVNARDAMPEGGTLTLSADVLELEPGDRRLEGWGVPAGRYVRMAVSDTGVGMDARTLDRAFEPFFTTKEKGKGTGLGLSTAFGIIKQSGGHMAAVSQPGQGTRFEVILPVSDVAPDKAPRPALETEHSFRGATILVAEDEAAVRKLVVRVLERQGCTVLSAENGVRAMEVVAGHEGPLDLVLTDLVMPDMGGRELANRLRASTPDLPILFMSGYDEEMVADAGAEWSFLGKPFTPVDLVRHVAETLRSGSERVGDAADA